MNIPQNNILAVHDMAAFKARIVLQFALGQ